MVMMFLADYKDLEAKIEQEVRHLFLDLVHLSVGVFQLL